MIPIQLISAVSSNYLPERTHHHHSLSLTNLTMTLPFQSSLHSLVHSTFPSLGGCRLKVSACKTQTSIPPCKTFNNNSSSANIRNHLSVRAPLICQWMVLSSHNNYTLFNLWITLLNPQSPICLSLLLLWWAISQSIPLSPLHPLKSLTPPFSQPSTCLQLLSATLKRQPMSLPNLTCSSLSTKCKTVCIQSMW